MAFDLELFLLQFLILVGGAAIFRRMARAIGQPPVIGEIGLGILLGPTALHLMLPDVYDYLFAPDQRTLIEGLGWIGLILFIYTVGAELHWDPRESWPIFFIALGGLIVPFLTGGVLSLLRPDWFFSTEPTIRHMILVGCIMSVSALAVLGRLLADADMLRTRAASLSLGASTIDDIVAWILVALVAGSGDVGLARDIRLNVLFLLLVFAAVLAADRYLTPRIADRIAGQRPVVFAFLLFAIFGSALVTHAAGLHALIGAFAVGGLVSRHPAIRKYTQTRLGELTSVLFLPAFFVLMGMNVDLTALEFPEAFGTLAIIVVAATACKIIGAYVGGRSIGVSTFTSLQVGILLNNRGAVDLVVAKIGYDAGLLSTGGFALLVMMITITTLFSPVSLALLNRFGSARARSA